MTPPFSFLRLHFRAEYQVTMHRLSPMNERLSMTTIPVALHGTQQSRVKSSIQREDGRCKFDNRHICTHGFYNLLSIIPTNTATKIQLRRFTVSLELITWAGRRQRMPNEISVRLKLKTTFMRLTLGHKFAVKSSFIFVVIFQQSFQILSYCTTCVIDWVRPPTSLMMTQWPAEFMSTSRAIMSSYHKWTEERELGKRRYKTWQQNRKRDKAELQKSDPLQSFHVDVVLPLVMEVSVSLRLVAI